MPLAVYGGQKHLLGDSVRRMTGGMSLDAFGERSPGFCCCFPKSRETSASLALTGTSLVRQSERQARAGTTTKTQ